ncbi:MAG: ribonuclease HII [Methylococcales bacterium]|nr:ribonuclease HII [Methylococcales bacterium]
MIAGIDEVGRGCLAGSVIAAAVILDPDRPITGLADSKTITVVKRKQLAALIYERALAWSIGRAEVSEIDQLNILQASLLAMKRAYFALVIKPDWVKVDGIHYPSITCEGETIVKGDQRVAEISAASIIAKVARDSEMEVLDAVSPGYEFSRHKAYPTRLHLQRLHEQGVSDIHRKSFAPVRKILNQSCRME